MSPEQDSSPEQVRLYLPCSLLFPRHLVSAPGIKPSLCPRLLLQEATFGSSGPFQLLYLQLSFLVNVNPHSWII